MHILNHLGESHLARPHIECFERKLFCSEYVSSTDETSRVYFAKEIRNWNCQGCGNYLKKSSTWMISRVCFSLLIHMPCQLVNTAVRSVLPFDPDASDLPVAWGLGFGFVWLPHESKL